MGSTLANLRNVDTCSAQALQAVGDLNQQVALATVQLGCELQTQLTNLRDTGVLAAVLVLADDMADVVLSENSPALPAMTVPSASVRVADAWFEEGLAIIVSSQSVELRASVGNLARNVIIRGAEQRACTEASRATCCASKKTFRRFVVVCVGH